MIRILTSDIAIRFFGGVAIGLALVFGAPDLLLGTA